jgi:hypothetical protein
MVKLSLRFDIKGYGATGDPKIVLDMDVDGLITRLEGVVRRRAVLMALIAMGISDYSGLDDFQILMFVNNGNSGLPTVQLVQNGQLRFSGKILVQRIIFLLPLLTCGDPSATNVMYNGDGTTTAKNMEHWREHHMSMVDESNPKAMILLFDASMKCKSQLLTDLCGKKLALRLVNKDIEGISQYFEEHGGQDAKDSRRSMIVLVTKYASHEQQLQLRNLVAKRMSEMTEATAAESDGVINVD